MRHDTTIFRKIIYGVKRDSEANTGSRMLAIRAKVEEVQSPRHPRHRQSVSRKLVSSCFTRLHSLSLNESSENVSPVAKAPIVMTIRPFSLPQKRSMDFPYHPSLASA